MDINRTLYIRMTWEYLMCYMTFIALFLVAPAPVATSAAWHVMLSNKTHLYSTVNQRKHQDTGKYRTMEKENRIKCYEIEKNVLLICKIRFLMDFWHLCFCKAHLRETINKTVYFSLMCKNEYFHSKPIFKKKTHLCLFENFISSQAGWF